MSAQKALKGTSLRDSLAKTVRLLTKQGIDVQFRGHQPHVVTKGNKAVRLVLPELNDNAPDELIEALQGFLDHEVGHIFYTPFGRASKFASNRTRHSLTNIIEDIRLEKLLPRDLPGTKENLERMYDNVMPTFFGPVALKANEKGTDKSEAFSCVMVCAMRALSGQKAFQKFMDDNKLWPHFMPLIAKMPNISRRLRDLETFEDVERLVEDVLEALKPPPPPPNSKPDKDDKGEKQKQKSDDVAIDEDADDEKDDGASDDSQAGDNEQSDDADSDDKSDDGKKREKDDEQDSDGKGHGDGEGEDDGSDEEGGDCSGDEEGDEDGDGSGDGDDGEDDGPSDRDETDDADEQGSAGEGKMNRTLKDALAALEPKHRRALFLYKKKRQTVAEIAADLEVSEEDTRDMLAQARRQVRDFLNGG